LLDSTRKSVGLILIICLFHSSNPRYSMCDCVRDYVNHYKHYVLINNFQEFSSWQKIICIFVRNTRWLEPFRQVFVVYLKIYESHKYMYNKWNVFLYCYITSYGHVECTKYRGYIKQILMPRILQ
jgi:hypothetical protein